MAYRAAASIKAAALALLLVAAASSPVAAADRSVLLVTLDTTRADALGCYGGAAKTPNIDALARNGVRYQRAIATAPTTAPSHASLLTGRYPQEVGVVSNGTDVLSPNAETLATFLKRRKYSTAAFVSSRVLDHRFGFNRGFDTYDDAMPAEQLGEYGYPERGAEQVSDAAIKWMARRSGPQFVWVHYYDPHSPYQEGPPGAEPEARYRAEIELVDRELGRVIAAFRKNAPDGVIAVVGDHGEALGDHGEETHGIFLYDSVLRVPLVISGGGVTPAVIGARVSARAVARSLLKVATGEDVRTFGEPLPVSPAAAAQPSYSFTELPRVAYGWTPLESWSDGRWKLVAAPRVELYDLRSDPREMKNVAARERRQLARLRKELEAFKRQRPRRVSSVAADPEIAADLRSLGYMSGSRTVGPAIDPKDGVKMLAELARARELAGARQLKAAEGVLQGIVRANPGNVVFLTELGRLQLSAGEPAKAISSYRAAVAVNPALDLLHFNLGDALLKTGNAAAAEKEFHVALELNPRSAAAAIRLSEIAIARGERARAKRVLAAATAAGAESASVLARHAELELADGNHAAARQLATRATEVAGRWSPAWMILARLSLLANDVAGAERSLRRATSANPYDARAFLELGRLLARSGRREEAKAALQRSIQVTGERAVGDEARRILTQL